MAALRILSALVMVAAFQVPAFAQPPDLDCSEGFDGLRTTAMTQPGALETSDADATIVSASEPDVWKVEYTFTLPGRAPHPAVMMRTYIKQVTGVWTAQSKGCGFGDQRQFAAMMADAKERDSVLTNASRAEVERKKQDASPLAPAP